MGVRWWLLPAGLALSLVVGEGFPEVGVGQVHDDLAPASHRLLASWPLVRPLVGDHLDKIKPWRDVQFELVIFGLGVAVGLGAEAEVDDLGSIALLFIETHDPLLRLVDRLSDVDGLPPPEDLGGLSIVLPAKHSIFDKLPGSWLLRDVFGSFSWGWSWFLSFAASRENLTFSSLYHLEEVVCLLGGEVVLGTLAVRATFAQLVIAFLLVGFLLLGFFYFLEKMTDLLVFHCWENRGLFNYFALLWLHGGPGLSPPIFLPVLLLVLVKFFILLLVFLLGLLLLPAMPVSLNNQLAVLKQSHSYLETHLDPFLHRIWYIFQHFVVKKGPVGGLNGVGKRNAQSSQQDGPSCWYLALVDFEYAGVVPEHGSYISQKFWKYPGLVVETLDYRKLGPVHEGVLLLGVPMEIQKHW